MSTLFRVSWMKAFSFCKNNKLQLATLYTEDESANFLKIIDQNNAVIAKLFGTIHFILIHIGVTSPMLNKEDPKNTIWYWFGNGKKINYTIPYAEQQPNDVAGAQRCGQYQKRNDQGRDVNGFNDYGCSNENTAYIHSFVCQDVKTY